MVRRHLNSADCLISKREVWAVGERCLSIYSHMQLKGKGRKQSEKQYRLDKHSIMVKIFFENFFFYYKKSGTGPLQSGHQLQCWQKMQNSSNFFHVSFLLSTHCICSMPSTPPLILPSPLTPVVVTPWLWPAPSLDPLPSSDFLVLHGKTQGHVNTLKQTLAWCQRQLTYAKIPQPPGKQDPREHM